MNNDKRKNDDNNDWRELLKKVKKKGEDNGKNPFKGGKFRFSMWYLLLAVLLLSLLNMFMFKGNDKSIPYSDFKELI
ncbi:MAG: cell division protein FtsH, partial [Spirochaetaceae bacterium]|nr:cell division protein FtsH [Spirochaetaceae bacterium]